MPDAQAVRASAQKQGLTLPEDLLVDDRVHAMIVAEVERLSSEFKGFEKPRAVGRVGEEFTTANGLLTPTLKLKRREVLERHGKIIDDLYAGLAAS